MVRLLRISAFALVMLLTIGVFLPGTADTVAAQPNIRHITLIDDGVETKHETTVRTIGNFLQEEGITLYPADEISHDPRLHVSDGLVLKITRAFNVNITIKGETDHKTVDRGTNVAEIKNYLQNELEITLLFDGSLEKQVYEEDSLEFDTWRSRIEAETTKIPYETEQIVNHSLPRGTVIVLREGELGETRVETTVVYINEEEYTREFLGVFTSEPITRLEEISPSSAFALGELTDTGCPSFGYVRRLVMNASAYTAGFSCTGKRPGHPAYRITRSGREVEHGIVAVDPAFIPLGTRLYVEGYGFALAADTGGAIRGYKIDLFMEYIGDALRFGRRNVTVFILE